MLSDAVLESARLLSGQINGEFGPLWGGGSSGQEVTFPQFAASTSNLGNGGSYFHLIRSSSAGMFRGATCLYGMGDRGAGLFVSLYVEASPGVFAIRTVTGDLSADAGFANGEVGGDFGLPVDLESGDRAVLGLTWSTIGSGAAPTVGARTTVLAADQPYGHHVKATAHDFPPPVLNFASLPAADLAPWMGLYK